MSSPVIFTRIIEACKTRNKQCFSALLDVLLEDSLCPKEHSQGNTVAHYCYTYGYIEGVEELIDRGLRPMTHSTNNLNQTPLHVACEHQQYDMVFWHIELNHSDSDYRLQDSRSGYTPSMWLVTHGHYSLLETFAKRGYINPNVVSTYRLNTHFTLAIQKNQPEVVRLLYNYGLCGPYGVLQERNNGSLHKDFVLAADEPERMFSVMKNIGCLLPMFSAHSANYGETLALCIMKNKTKMFVCMVLEGFARPNEMLELFAYSSHAQRCLFVEALEERVQVYNDFVRGFLALTVRSGLPKKSKAHHLLERFQPGINQQIADYAGVAYGRTLLYLYESIAFIESF